MAETKATTLFTMSIVKTWLGVTDTSDDARIVEIADAVSERIEAETHRVFVTRSIPETRNGDGTRKLSLRKFPVGAVSSLTIKDTAYQVTPTPYVQGTDFDVDLVIGVVLLRARSFTRGFQNVAVTYTAGWGPKDDLGLPADIYQAGLDYVKAVWNELTTNAIAATSVSLGPSTFMLKPQMPYGIKRVIDNWRVARV